MTLGIDVSALFRDMIMATNTKDLVQKKLVYQYLCHYATSNQELSLLAVNTLLKDCRDSSPMVCSARLVSSLSHSSLSLSLSLSLSPLSPLSLSCAA